MVKTKKIKCAYHLCNKEIEESKSIKSCAEKDQMTHEL